MAPVPTFIEVTYLDNANRRSVQTYRITPAFEDDGSNIAAVLAAITELETEFNTLTQDHVENVAMKVNVGGGGAAAAVTANNQVSAFIRTFLANGKRGSIEVPAWDDPLYSQNEQNLLSEAFNTAAALLLNHLLDPETGSAMNEVKYSQSRARRGAKRLD